MEPGLRLKRLKSSGKFVTVDKLAESTMQAEIMQCFLSRGVDVIEGTELGGGETDLLLYHQLVVENKVISNPTSKPFGAASRFSWQARRYSIALRNNVAFVALAYRPATDADLLPLPERVRVIELKEASEERCEVRFVIPWGTGVPSSAKPPAGSRSGKGAK